MESFVDLGLSPDTLKVLEGLKFVTPTPIQAKSIPVVLEGKDVIGIAQTGTGKTMAFGIPTVQRLVAEGGQALILVPTRELAHQIEDALEPLLKPFNMTSATLIGGLKMSDQVPDIKNNPSILIATPGRLNDLIYSGLIELSGVSVVIIDEADRMFDMGFEDQVNSVLRCVIRKDQTLLFSATMPPSVKKLASQYMEEPVTVEIASSGTNITNISQELFIVHEPQKDDVLKMLVQKYRGTIIVFTKTKIKASKVTSSIKGMGAKVAEIHSDRNMSQRNQALEGFKSGRYRVLVATDIAARGIDVNMIELVINYDLPDDAENYVHRIGRTGRAGEEGHAVTFATPREGNDIRQIENLTKIKLPRSTHPQFSKGTFSEGKSKTNGSGQKRRFSRKAKE